MSLVVGQIQSNTDVFFTMSETNGTAIYSHANDAKITSQCDTGNTTEFDLKRENDFRMGIKPQRQMTERLI